MQGVNSNFTFDSAENVLVVKFANEQDIKQWDVVIRKPWSSRISEKKYRVFPRGRST